MPAMPVVYRCQDRWLAAALITLGLPLLGTETHPRQPGEKPGPAWTVFVLEDRPDRPRWVREYQAKTLKLPVTQLRTAYNRLRNVTQNATPGAVRGEA